MDLSNIEIGNTYKNYGALCDALEEEVRYGSSKLAQLKRWSYHFLWKKNGHQITITNLVEKCNETLTEKEFVLKFGSQKQKESYTGSITHTIRKSILAHANRLCDVKYDKDKKKYIITRYYKIPIPRSKNDRIASSLMAMTEQERSLHGVYCIKNDDTIYIGSTMRSFYIRFSGHYLHPQEQMQKTKELFDNGSKMFILYAAKPDDTEEYIRNLEKEYIHKYVNSEYKLLNYINASNKKVNKYKSIKVHVDDYEEAINLLTTSNIKFKE